MEDFTPTTELEMLANGDTITHHVLRPTFTVVLLYPDYATGDFGADVYVSSFETARPQDAARLAQLEAVSVNDQIQSADDMRCILVLRGTCKISLDATSFESASIGNHG